MKENVCLVCLKTFQSFPNNGNSLSPPPPQDEKCGAPLLTKFLKFTKNYLKVSSPVPDINRSGGETFPGAFCESCELAVITPICQVYLEYISAQVRLSWEMEQLGKLLDNSQLDIPNQSRVMNMRKLTEQLGVEGPSNLEQFRSLLSQKCQLKRKETLPDVLVQSGCRTDESIRLQMNSIVKRNDDDDEDEVLDPLYLPDAVNPYEEQSDEDEMEETFEVTKNGSFELKNMVIKIKVEPAQFLPDDHLMVDPESEDVEEQVDDRQCSSIALVNWHKCSKCERFFESQNGLAQHTSKCSGIKKKTAKQATDLAGATVAFPCRFCDRLFPTSKCRNNHQFKTHPKKLFKCPKCKYNAKTRDHLEHHLIAIHNPQTHACAQCPKTFTTRMYLNHHIRKAHPVPVQTQLPPRRQQKVFCTNPSCDRHFSSRAKLNFHLTKCSYTVPLPTKNQLNVNLNTNEIKIEKEAEIEDLY